MTTSSTERPGHWVDLAEAWAHRHRARGAAAPPAAQDFVRGLLEALAGEDPPRTCGPGPDATDPEPTPR